MGQSDTEGGAVRAALYARISHDDRGDQAGVNRQLGYLRELAERRGWHVVDEYVDNDVSAWNGAERANYRRLMSDAASGEVDLIAAWEGSRLWRAAPERAYAIEQLGSHGVRLAAGGNELDLATSQGRQLARVTGEPDTMESDQKSERVAAAARQRAEEGRANGAPAYGWRRERVVDGAGRVTSWHDVEDEAEAEVVREIVRRLLAGDAIRRIADDLDQRGVPTPSRRPGVRWRHTTVRKLALRPANAGLRVHHGEVIGDAAWPAIVALDQHERVTALLTKGDSGVKRQAARRHLLSYGVGRCGVCGSVLRGAVNRQRGREYPMYTCEAHGCVGRSRDRVDEWVQGVVCAWLARPAFAAAFAADDGAAADADARAADAHARLGRVAEMREDGVLSREEAARRAGPLREAAQAAEAEAQRLRAGPNLADVDAELLGPRAAEVWQGLTLQQRHRALEVLGVVVTIHPQRHTAGPRFDPDAVVVSAAGFSTTAQP